MNCRRVGFIISIIFVASLAAAVSVDKVQVIGRGIVVNPSDVADFSFLKIVIANVIVEELDNEEFGLGVMFLDEDKYKLKDVEAGEDSASADVYSGEDNVGTIKLTRISKPGGEVWAGILSIHGTDKFAYVLTAKREFDDDEKKGKIGEFCSENPEKCAADARQVCQTNPDSEPCRKVLRQYCAENPDDVRCRHFTGETQGPGIACLKCGIPLAQKCGMTEEQCNFEASLSTGAPPTCEPTEEQSKCLFPLLKQECSDVCRFEEGKMEVPAPRSVSFQCVEKCVDQRCSAFDQSTRQYFECKISCYKGCEQDIEEKPPEACEDRCTFYKCADLDPASREYAVCKEFCANSCEGRLPGPGTGNCLEQCVVGRCSQYPADSAEYARCKESCAGVCEGKPTDPCGGVYDFRKCDGTTLVFGKCDPSTGARSEGRRENAPECGGTTEACPDRCDGTTYLAGGFRDAAGVCQYQTKIANSDKCGGVQCPDKCDGTTLLSNGKPNAAGVCEYATKTENSTACGYQAPVDRCANVVCNDKCDGTTLLNSGKCNPDTGSCDYLRTANSPQCTGNAT
jgi:hypothetical protein